MFGSVLGSARPKFLGRGPNGPYANANACVCANLTLEKFYTAYNINIKQRVCVNAQEDSWTV